MVEASFTQTTHCESFSSKVGVTIQTYVEIYLMMIRNNADLLCLNLQYLDVIGSKSNTQEALAVGVTRHGGSVATADGELGRLDDNRPDSSFFTFNTQINEPPSWHRTICQQLIDPTPTDTKKLGRCKRQLASELRGWT